MTKKRKKVAHTHDEKGARGSKQAFVKDVKGSGGTDLPPKRERFAQLVAIGSLSHSDCYREAYNAHDRPDKTAHESASRLMANDKVLTRIAELRTPIVERVGMALQDHVNELARLMKKAEDNGQLSAAINAEVARGRALGHQGGFRAGMLDDMTEAELEDVAQGKTPRKLKLA